MAHQTGIKCNEKLLSIIAKVKRQHDKTRLILVNIDVKKEQLQICDDTCYEICGDWIEDYRKYVSGLIAPKEPCYLLFRLDSINESG